jgi:hypothetical protein
MTKICSYRNVLTYFSLYLFIPEIASYQSMDDLFMIDLYKENATKFSKVDRIKIGID